MSQGCFLFGRDFEALRMSESDGRVVEITSMYERMHRETEQRQTCLDKVRKRERSRRLCRRGRLGSDNALYTIY